MKGADVSDVRAINVSACSVVIGDLEHIQIDIAREYIPIKVLWTNPMIIQKHKKML